MNPCLAELTIGGCAGGHRMLCFAGGFRGIKDNMLRTLRPEDVYGLHRRGGTAIKTDRLPELVQPDMQRHLADVLQRNAIDALVVLGGDGSFRGADTLCKVAIQTNFIGIPCTIDNNVYGSEYSLGHDTALNKLVAFIDDITDTGASMYPRVFFVETLGGPDSYFSRLPVRMGISDFCITPECPITAREVTAKIDSLLRNGQKNYVIVTVAEEMPQTGDIISHVKQTLGISVKYNLIGYQQRGGNPTALDRLHAAGFARKALDAAQQGMRNIYIAYEKGQYAYKSLTLAIRRKNTSDDDYVLKERYNDDRI